MTYTGLYLGSLHLTGTAAAGYKVETLAEGTDFGNPEPVEAVVQSLLQDGDLVEHLRDGNRAQNLRIRITGTAAQLQLGEAALMAELYKRNTLTVPPLLAGGATTVFDIVTSSLEQIPDDLAEVQANQWHYSVRLVSLPFGRSEDEVAAPALAASGSTTTLVNNGSATTNWTGQVNGVSATPSVVSGAVKVASSAVLGEVTVAAIYTASITTSATKYLKIDWKPESNLGMPTLRAYGDGVELERLSQMPSPTAGFTRTWFYVTASSIAVLRLESLTNIAAGGGSIGLGVAAVRSLSIDNIDRTDVKPAIGTNRQLLRSIDVRGSARSEGSIAIEHATSSLGQVLAYFFPDADTDGQPIVGYSPPLRQYRFSGGGTTVDASTVSGSYENDLSLAAVNFDVPVSRLPAGTYVPVVRIQAIGAVTSANISAIYSTYLGGSSVGSGLLAPSTPCTVSSAAYSIHALTRVQLPILDADPNSSAVVRVNMLASAAVRLDEAWLFNTTIGQLVSVDLGTAAASATGGSNRLWIDSPTLVRPRPTMRRGFAADRSDSYYPADTLTSWMTPEFSPPRVNVFTVTSNALDASVKLQHWPHWHTHAGS